MHQMDVFSFTLWTLYPDKTAPYNNWTGGLVGTKAYLNTV
jgi:hypothetical protein